MLRISFMASTNDASGEHTGKLSRNARIGLVLFAIYLLLYAGFVLLNVFGAEWMAVTILDVNISVWYGLGLIIAALALALVYAFLCRSSNAGNEEQAQ